MSTAIESLPLYQMRLGLGDDEDFLETLVFVFSDGSPLALDGIAFTLTVGCSPSPLAILSTVDGSLRASGNTLLVFVPAASKRAWSGEHIPIALLATDPTGSPLGGPRNVDVFTRSCLTVGPGRSSPLALTKVAGMTLISRSDPQLVALLAQVATLTTQVATLTAEVAALQAGGATGGGTGGGTSSPSLDFSDPNNSVFLGGPL